jgi:hypothetical protein
MRGVTLLLAVVALGCGGDSGGPSTTFPNAAGNYNITGGFDGFTASQASFTGTVTLTQASQTQGTLGGSMTVTATFGGDDLTGSDGSLEQASVATNGAITFTMTDPNGTWTFDGTLSGSSITQGRHSLNAPGTGTISGSWSGTRTSSSASAMSIRGTASRLAGIASTLKR